MLAGVVGCAVKAPESCKGILVGGDSYVRGADIAVVMIRDDRYLSDLDLGFKLYEKICSGELVLL